MEQIVRLSGAAEEELFFWGVHNRAEVDLLLFHRGRRYGLEVKYTDTLLYYLWDGLTRSGSRPT